MIPLESGLQGLALEGGGGKVPVFLGAVRALAEAGLLASSGGRRDSVIQHFVGSSTGALVATFLACGADPAQLEHLVAGLMNQLVDAGAPFGRIRPSLRRGENEMIEFTCSAAERVSVLPPILAAGLRRYGSVAGLLRSLLPLERAGSRFRRWMLERMGVDAPLVEAVRRDVPAAIWSLYVDGGLLDGCEVRHEIERLISASVAERTGRKITNLTFRQHHAIFDRDLSLVATNISSGKSLALTKALTPDLPLADAVRICIGLPPIVKPVYFSPEAAEIAGASAEYGGLWIDGGILNRDAIRGAERRSTAPVDRWLTLRLGSDRTRHFTEAVDDTPIFRFLPRTLLEMMWSNAHDQPAKPYTEHVLTLDCDNLSAHRFLPEPEAIERAQHRAYHDVLRYLASEGVRSPANDLPS